MQNNQFILIDKSNKIIKDKKFIPNSHYGYIRNLWECWKFSCLEPHRTNEPASFNHFLSWIAIIYFPTSIILWLWWAYINLYIERKFLSYNLILIILFLTIILFFILFYLFYFYITKDYKNYSIHNFILFYKAAKKKSANKAYILVFPAAFISIFFIWLCIILFITNNF